jgi:hypothetical protein
MARLRYQMPGVNGSLGACAICGDTFLREILMGERIGFVQLNEIDRDLPAHKKCGDAVRNLVGTWDQIRDRFPKGPMYDALDEEYEKHKNDK